jgi:hypothetical protein
MKKTIGIASLVLIAACAMAQGNLQFNQALIISGTAPQTVPADKVWKVTSMYGSEFVLNQCVTNAAVNNWLGLRCLPLLQAGEGSRSTRVSYFIAQLTVNGTQVVSELTGMPVAGSVANDATCSNTSWATNQNLSCANRTMNPNLLPMWLPAGTTVATNASTVFASVIEFNVVP